MEEKIESRSLEDLAKNGLEVEVGSEQWFSAPEDPESDLKWFVNASTCEDIAEVKHEFKAPGDEKKAKEEEEGDEDKKDSAKSLQKDEADEEEDDEDKDEEASEEKADTGARHFWVTGLEAGECEIKLALAGEGFDWEDEATWEDAKELVTIPVDIDLEVEDEEEAAPAEKEE